MGYHVPFVAPPGRDGGVDVIAYKDPLGTVAPRIKAQIKHREEKVTVREVRELECNGSRSFAASFSRYSPVRSSHSCLTVSSAMAQGAGAGGIGYFVV